VLTHKGLVVWLYGLSGAGKSTLCDAIATELRKEHFKVMILDGDEMRKHLCADLGFSYEDRIENIRRIGYVARLLANADVIVLVAAITPFAVMREFLRTNLDSFLEVFVDAPLSVCEARDPKGLYKRSRSGALKNFTGITSPFETPHSPDVICRTNSEEIEESVQRVHDAIIQRLEPPAESEKVHLERHRTIAVDFHGVVANYDYWQGIDILGSPREDVSAVLRKLHGEGWKIIVYTTRGPEHGYPYLQKHDIPFH
jgi:adenylylsulfate kinase